MFFDSHSTFSAALQTVSVCVSDIRLFCAETKWNDLSGVWRNQGLFCIFTGEIYNVFLLSSGSAIYRNCLYCIHGSGDSSFFVKREIFLYEISDGVYLCWNSNYYFAIFCEKYLSFCFSYYLAVIFCESERMCMET